MAETKRAWLLWACALSGIAAAQEAPSLRRENQELRKRIERLEALIDPDGSGAPARVGLVLDEDQETFPTVRVTGFFQSDFGGVSQSDRNRAMVGDAQDGADFRRARLAAVGRVAENVAYSVEFDFAFPGRPSFMDVWGEVQGLPLLQNVRFGQYRNPMGVDGLTSVKNLTFLERALPFAFLPFRQVGVMAHGTWTDETSTWAVSAFRFPTDAFGGNVGDNGGYGLAARLTTLALVDGDDVLHVGGAFSVIDPANDLVQYRSQPEFFVSETGSAVTPDGAPVTEIPLFVDTGPIPTHRIHLFAAEAVMTSGPWHAQGELMYSVVDRPSAPDATFSGAFAQVGYIFTGEHRSYDRKSGVLGPIVPAEPFDLNGGLGALEAAARWSRLDLNRSGTLTNLTAGLNWYLNAHTKLQLNYIHVLLESPGIGDSSAHVLALRAQVDF